MQEIKLWNIENDKVIQVSQTRLDYENRLEKWIIELKRDKTYREVIAQILDYATWVKDLDYDDLNNILNNKVFSFYKLLMKNKSPP